MSDDWNREQNGGPEEPERVFIPTPPPRPEPRPGAGRDTTALIFGIASVLLSSCLPPAAVVFSVLAFVYLKRFREDGGEWRGPSISAALLAGLGVLFSVLSVILVVISFVTKDPNSIYGFFNAAEDPGVM